MPKTLAAVLRSGLTGGESGRGRGPRYPESNDVASSEAAADESVLDGVGGALGVAVSEGGTRVPVEDGSKDTASEVPVVVGVVGVVVAAEGSPAVPVGLAVEVALGDMSGVSVGLGDGLMTGRGRGPAACSRRGRGAA